MIGAIVGDIIGSVYEGTEKKSKDFPLFHPRSNYTDDTVLTIAVADWILNGGDLVELFHSYYHNFPDGGYGGMFLNWAYDRRREPYNSFGNGSAMRVSPVGFAFGTMEEVLDWAKRSAEVTHNHPEGIRGAQATAAAIFLARRIKNKEEIRSALVSQFGYDLSTTLDDIRPGFRFDETCQKTVPPALIAFFESTSYEDAIRNAISLGGDTDTVACITGGIAEAYYGGVPREISGPALALLDKRLLETVQHFRAQFGIQS